MNTSSVLGLLLLGLIAGSLSSMVGIGGGILIVPALVFFFSLTQKTAQGTSLAMLLPPIGVFAVMNYWKAGFVNIKFAVILCIAFVVGSYLGSLVVVNLPDNVIKKVFGGFLLLVGIKYLFFDK